MGAVQLALLKMDTLVQEHHLNVSLLVEMVFEQEVNDVMTILMTGKDVVLGAMDGKIHLLALEAIQQQLIPACHVVLLVLLLLGLLLPQQAQQITVTLHLKKKLNVNLYVEMD